jgi:16S rRNA (cytosine1402-N4)-methyltransferase
VRFSNSSYHEVDGAFDAVLLDLGISFFHLEAGKGFSYMNEDEPLDMRYSEKTRITAEEVLNSFPLQEVEAIIRVYGEEPCAKNFVKVLGKARETRRIERVKDLLELIRGARECASHFRKSSKRIFQSLRIFVNQEIAVLRRFLKKAPQVVKKGGVLMIITYHSIEDREAKKYLKNSEEFEVLKPFPIKPSQKEVEETPNAKSAKMRVAIRR